MIRGGARSNGSPLPPGPRLTRDTVTVGPGERYDIAFTAEEAGGWAVHCHILHHVTNDDREPGGLLPPSERFSPFDPRCLTAFAVGARQRRQCTQVCRECPRWCGGSPGAPAVHVAPAPLLVLKGACFSRA